MSKRRKFESGTGKRQKLQVDLGLDCLTTLTFARIVEYSDPASIWSYANVNRSWRKCLQELPRKLVSKLCKYDIGNDKQNIPKLMMFYNLFDAGILIKSEYERLSQRLRFVHSDFAGTCLSPLSYAKTHSEFTQKRKSKNRLDLFFPPPFVRLLSITKKDVLYNPFDVFSNLMSYGLCNTLLVHFLRKFLTHPHPVVRQHITERKLISANIPVWLIKKCREIVLKKAETMGEFRSIGKLPDVGRNDVDYVMLLEDAELDREYYKQIVVEVLSTLQPQNPDEPRLVNFIVRNFKDRTAALAGLVSNYTGNLREESLLLLFSTVEEHEYRTESCKILRALLSFRPPSSSTFKTLQHFIVDYDWKGRLPKIVPYLLRENLLYDFISAHTAIFPTKINKQYCRFLAAIHRHFVTTNDPLYSIQHEIGRFLEIRSYNTIFASPVVSVGLIYYPHQPAAQFLRWQPDIQSKEKGAIAYNYLFEKWGEKLGSQELF